MRKTCRATGTTKANCTLSGGSTTTLTLPTFSGNYHSGESPAWIFLYFQASPAAIFAVVVLNGQGTYVGEETGSGCVSSVYQNETFPSSPIDSSTAGASAAGTTNGSAFVAAHSSADADYVLTGGYTEKIYNFSYTQPATWYVIFSTCSAGQEEELTGPGPIP